MKGFLKGCATLGGLLALGGFVVMLVGLAMGGSTRYLTYGPYGWGNDSPTAYTEAVDEVVIAEEGSHHEPDHHGGHAEATFTEEPEDTLCTLADLGAESFFGLEVDLKIGEVCIETGDEFSLRVEGAGPEYQRYIKDGTLHLETVNWNNNAMVDVDLSRIEHQTFYLTLPAGLELDEVELNMGAGSLTADGLTCRKLDADVGMGTLYLSAVTCTGEADLTAGMGELIADDFVCDGKADLEVSMGSLTLFGRLNSRTEIECGMGSVELTLDDPGNYAYAVDCGMGSVEIGGQSFSGSSKVKNGTFGSGGSNVSFDVDCGMGSVIILFE